MILGIYPGQRKSIAYNIDIKYILLWKVQLMEKDQRQYDWREWICDVNHYSAVVI